MSKKIGILSVLILCGLAVVSCHKDSILEEFDPSGDGKARIELTLNLASSQQQVNTKASEAEEKIIASDRVYILVVDKLDATGKLKQKPINATVVESDKIYAIISEENTESYLYVLANVSDTNIDYLKSIDVGKSLIDIKNNLTLDQPPQSGITNPFPMYGVSESIAQITKGKPVSGTAITLIRAVARIDLLVDATVTTDNFELVSLSLTNGARKGWMIPPDPIMAQSGVDIFPYDKVSSVENNAIRNQIYCYENGGKKSTFVVNPTRVVVEGRYNGATATSFYGIDIAYKSMGMEPLLYDIKRNYTYTIKITKVDKDGYSSYDEALRASSFNNGITSDIEVNDPYAHNIVTNGKQYLGTTNTSLLIYPQNNTTTVKDVIAATLSYTTDPGWSVGIIEASEGITFVSGRKEEPLNIGSGSTPVVKEVQINVDPDFKTGTINIHIGNLSQTIKVTKKEPTPAVGGVLTDFAYTDATKREKTTDYVVGEVINTSASWLKLSSEENSTDPSSLQDNITNTYGQIFIHVGSNVIFSSAGTPREAQLYVASRNNEQRTRVHVQQTTLDVYSGNRAIKPFTYVGTFHRWNQTGERLIRIEAKQEDGVTIDGSWIATVVYGDFIKLSTSPSPDPGIDPQDPYGEHGAASFTTDDQIEANCQITDGQRSVSGVISETVKNIYFRVGLTGKLYSEHSQPRYGLIALSYNGNLVQFIYVRQGEEPDYLMRPNDPVVYTSESTVPVEIQDPMAVRTHAQKLSVYNIKDVTNSTGVASSGVASHGFVRYPSQGGYYYFMSGVQTVAPGTVGPVPITASLIPAPTQNTPNPSFQKIWETCPYGYRRIIDGGTGYNFVEVNKSDKAATKAVVKDSENRQSYWLFPMKKIENSNFSNQIKGFLADGYFDRRNITQSIDDGVSKVVKRAVVSSHTIDAAYIGYLVFNPYNYASIFLPLSGAYYNISGGTNISHYFAGTFGGFLTATYSSNANVWITNFGILTTNTTDVFDNYTTPTKNVGYPIRCVKAENPPILSPPIDVGDFEPEDDNNKLFAARVEYLTADTDLKTKLEATHLVEQIKQINSLVISGDKSLTDDDYIYLNNIADLSADLTSSYKLQHITIRGRGNTIIPTSAFTSINWKTISFIDASELKDGAINLAAGSTLYNLTLGSFDAITIGTNAFGPNVNTTKTNLMLTGAEYDLVPKDGIVWRGKNWKSINEYK